MSGVADTRFSRIVETASNGRSCQFLLLVGARADLMTSSALGKGWILKGSKQVHSIFTLLWNGEHMDISRGINDRYGSARQTCAITILLQNIHHCPVGVVKFNEHKRSI
jgi:hypothetical protein